MIGYLEGQILRKSAHAIVLLVGGVGYELECPASTLWTLPSEGTLTQLEVLTFVREDAIRLFGFASGLDKQVFETLIGVSSVGPKLALALLGPFTGRELIDVLAFGETERLLSVPGVGQRKIEKLMVEIEPKLQKLRVASQEWKPSERPEMKNPQGPTGSLADQHNADGSNEQVVEPSQHPLFDDGVQHSRPTRPTKAGKAGADHESYETARAEKARRSALLADIESALANMGHREKAIKASLEWVEAEWREGSLAANLESTLKALLQRQSARLIAQGAQQTLESESDIG
jgi:Holliday junction DNA helicase RuvA subunit